MRQLQLQQEPFNLPWKLQVAHYRLHSYVYKLIHHTGYPSEFAISITSRCNSHCNHCARTHLAKDGSWDIRDMDYGLLMSLIRQIQKEYAHTNIMLGGGGEPLLYRYFDEFITETRRMLPDTRISVYSNLIALDQHIYTLIGNTTKLIASVNFTDATMYREKTGVDQYHQVTRNLQHFLKAKGNRTPSVKIQVFTATRNMAELHDFIRRWKPFLNANDGFMIVDLHNFTRFADLTQYYQSPPIYRRFPCRQPFIQFFVTASGHAYPCCMGSVLHNTHDKALHLGNLNEQSVSDVLDGDRLHKLRSNHLHGVYPGTCQSCDLWKTFRNYWFKFNGRWW